MAEMRVSSEEINKFAVALRDADENFSQKLVALQSVIEEVTTTTIKGPVAENIKAAWEPKRELLSSISNSIQTAQQGLEEKGTGLTSLFGSIMYK